MSKCINGEKIHKIIRINENIIHVVLKSGDIIEFAAKMVDYDDCELISSSIRR